MFQKKETEKISSSRDIQTPVPRKKNEKCKFAKLFKKYSDYMGVNEELDETIKTRRMADILGVKYESFRKITFNAI